MSFYRSESVKNYKLILPRDNAEQIMHILGQQNLIHIVPTSSSSLILQKPFLHQVKRCSDCLMKISDIQSVLEQQSILVKRKHFTNKQYIAFFQQWKRNHQEHSLNSINYLDKVDRQIQQIWHCYKQSSKRTEQIKNKMEFMRQNLAIINAGSITFGSSFFTDNNRRFDQIPFQFKQLSSPQVSMKAGVVSIQDQIRLKKTVFRISRNNCFTISIPFEKVFAENLLEEEKGKIVFFLLFSGAKGGYLDKKLNKLILTYSPKEYFLPQNPKELEKQKSIFQQQLKENKNILSLNQQQLKNYLTTISAFLPHQSFSKIQSFKLYLIKQKQIYNQLNQMQLYNNFLQGSIFILRKNIVNLQKCLVQIQKKTNLPSGQLIESKQEKIPTYFKVNQFTVSAQQIVDTYGAPRYKQANPSMFALVTFPFLFGVMFGDIAHGGLLMILGTILIFKKNLDYSVLKILQKHKYLIFLMGFFSMYCGFIYNEFMSISLNLFGSCYDVKAATPGQAIKRLSPQCVYALGLDPVWAVASNNLNFVNSLKMKIAVIIGVIHMTLGVFIKASNAIYFHKKLDFFFEFIPQLIFMIALFGYMDFLIIYKWLQPWNFYDANAPSIITTMINLPLNAGKTQNCCGGQPMWGSPQNTSQNSIQLFLLIISLITIPLMLIPKPLILIYGSKISIVGSDDIQQLLEEKQSDRSKNIQSLEKASRNAEETPSEIFVHQLIQTIEYVLGCISNTASYLRLWALSLAHSQLSQVFFQKTVEKGISLGFSGIPLMLLCFPVLAASTFAVLLCMDSMECFLHTLRLHWVEFQNKFYKGDGFSFKPFSFKDSIAQHVQQI